MQKLRRLLENLVFLLYGFLVTQSLTTGSLGRVCVMPAMLIE